MHRLGVLAVVLVLLASFTACADREEVRDVPESEEALESVPPAGDIDADEPLDVVEVEVLLKDFSIEMPERIPATWTRFIIRNQGDVAHNFRVVGPGVESQLSTPLQPGEGLPLEVGLEPGMYEVLCPMENHPEEAMRRELVVGEPEGVP